MNRTSVLGRKLIYLSVLVAMLIPLYLLGQPAGGGTDVGGRLSEMRHEFNIAESDLGEISPASETMKLASLGLRGVAASLLWKKTHEYRITHEWDRLKAAVNNIALLQPHSDKVWEFHAHNLTYNVSTEFDDYRQRYEMVREGTEFLQQGVRQNRNATRLVWYTGWFYGSKMGMSDEKKQFRKLFADDEVLHAALLKENIAVDSPEARGPLYKPDNWLVGRLWLNKGYELVDTGVKIRRQTPLNFYETGPKWRIKHAEAIESEGILDDRAQARWQLASEDWTAFGNRSIPTTSPFTIKLGQLDELLRQREQRFEEFKELVGETYTAARQKLINELPDDFKTVWSKPVSERTPSDEALIPLIDARVVPDLAAVAKASDPSVRLEAISLVGEIADLDARSNKTNGYRTQINFPYWERLAQAEQEERTVKARRLIYEAEQANDVADLDKAIAYYDEAFQIWAEIFDDYPILTMDDTAEDLYESIRSYMVAIDSQEFPDGFPLEAFAIMMSQDQPIHPDTYREVQKAMAEADEEERRAMLKVDRSGGDAEPGEVEKETVKLAAPNESPQPDASGDPAASGEDEKKDDDTKSEEESAQPKEPSPKSDPAAETPASDNESPPSEEPVTEEPDASEPDSEEPVLDASPGDENAAAK